MRVRLLDNPIELGKAAATQAAAVLNRAIADKGKARLVLSTGASQFDTLKSLVTMDVPWDRVEMFHLDEYVGLPESHPASFRKYLKERFISKVPLKQAYLVDGEGDYRAKVAELTAALRQGPIDLALVGIGENAHIAFNDPPANFETREAYIVVDLAENCKKQQVGEGWFPTPADVPKQAISMTVFQIMQSQTIIAPVPYGVKADAIAKTLAHELTNQIPATALKTHPDVTVYIDKGSAARVDPELLKKYS